MENEELFKILAGQHPIKLELKEKLNEMVKKETYSKSQIILKPSQVANRSWYIQKGSAMGYTYKEERKVPFWFWHDKDLMVPINSFFSQKPSETYIELLEPSVLFSISYEHVQQLTKLFPDTNDYIRQVMQDYHQMSQKRILQLASLTPEEHYLNLMRDSPSIFLKASVESIAAYLGISRKTLNRIRTRTRRYS
jgi:CRP-like cAMP-binding protein